MTHRDIICEERLRRSYPGGSQRITCCILSCNPYLPQLSIDIRINCVASSRCICRSGQPCAKALGIRRCWTSAGICALSLLSHSFSGQCHGIKIKERNHGFGKSLGGEGVRQTGVFPRSPVFSALVQPHRFIDVSALCHSQASALVCFKPRLLLGAMQGAVIPAPIIRGGTWHAKFTS